MEELEAWVQAVERTDPYEVLQKVMNAHRNDIIELNREQLSRGIKSTGERLSPYRSELYKKKRQRAGLQTKDKDLKFTGTLWGQMYSLAFEKFTEVGSKDKKEIWVEGMEGTEIWGLTDESIDKLLFDYGALQDFIDLYIQQINDL